MIYHKFHFNWKTHMLVEKTIEVNIGINPNEFKIIQLGKISIDEEKTQFITILCKYCKKLSWTYANIIGLDTNLVIHNLVLAKLSKIVKQKLQNMHPKVALLV